MLVLLLLLTSAIVISDIMDDVQYSLGEKCRYLNGIEKDSKALTSNLSNWQTDYDQWLALYRNSNSSLKKQPPDIEKLKSTKVPDFLKFFPQIKSACDWVPNSLKWIAIYSALIMDTAVSVLVWLMLCLFIMSPEFRFVFNRV